VIGLDYFEYRAASALKRDDLPFYALIAAAMWRADSFNAATLRASFPQVWDDLQARYLAPGGVLDSDPPALREKVLAGEIT
jgi:hypothetical protein